MPDQNPFDPQLDTEPSESFGDLLSQYEREHARQPEQLQGTVVSITADSVLLDIGYKTEGILPLSAFQNEEVKPGDRFPVTVKGRDPEGYYELTRSRVALPKDWSALERAFAEKSTIIGTVTAMIKGGFSVDVGVRAFMPASRSGVRDTAEMEKLVGQEIRCRITKLDSTEEDLVVDRRAVLEEEERSAKQRRYADLKEGDIVNGSVRNLADYGAFVDIGGVDGLLHVADISWSRVNKPSDVLSIGQEVEVKVLKLDSDKQRISLGLKQLQPHPWDSVAGKYKTGERVRGTVTRLADFGAFVELEPGVEGLIHISEMSWAKKVRKPSDVVKAGDTVEVVILGVNVGEQRLSLGLKQALGDPWAEVPQKFPVGSAIQGAITSIAKFGAFVQVAEGVEGMVHVSEIDAEKRINHPQDVLKLGQVIQAQVIGLDPGRRLMRLSMKQLVPTGLDEYIAEHKRGDVITGRVIEESAGSARVQLGEGIQATCRLTEIPAPPKEDKSATKADLSSLTSMLQARWKGGSPTGTATKPGPIHTGQIRSFRIARLDPDSKTIELELV
ncbi:MAG TPA: 30S ribosomal protein S1 [Terriglobales bacterium]|nr:30S ribosomal protein S1 [Terriglobales bacterium]